jgi:hypothetical protein
MLAYPLARPLARAQAAAPVAGLAEGWQADFCRSALPGGMALSRAGSAGYWDAAGVWQTAGSNLARFDHDPASHAPQGLLIEEARTNRIVTSTGSGALTLSGGTATLTEGYGTAPDGTSSSLYVKATGSFPFVFADYWGAADNQTWCLSVFVKKGGNNQFPVLTAWFLGGDTGVKCNRYLNPATGEHGDAGGGDPAVASGLVDCGDWWRYWVVLTNNASGNTGIRWVFVPDSGGEPVEIWGYQAEQGGFPTSYIATGGSAVTRAADVLAMGDLRAIGHLPGAGSLMVEWQVPHRLNGDRDSRLLTLSDGSADNALALAVNAAGEAAGDIVTGGAGQLAAAGTAIAAGTVYRTALGFAAAGAGLVHAGTAAGDSAVALPPVGQLRLGDNAAGTLTLNGHLRRLAYWPWRLADSQLMSLTA